jgi:hypothetical protein
VPFGLVLVQNLFYLLSQLFINARQSFRHILMHRAFADAEDLCCLPDGTGCLENVLRYLNRSLSDIVLHFNPPD